MMGSNVDRYEEYAKQKEELGNSIKELTIRIEQLNQEISLQEIQVDQCQKEFKKAKEAYEKLLKSRSIGNMAERAINVYSRLEERLIERQGKILQDEFLKCFSSIINKDNFVDGIIIDKNINNIHFLIQNDKIRFLANTNGPDFISHSDKICRLKRQNS